jgi:hypothetical protein
MVIQFRVFNLKNILLVTWLIITSIFATSCSKSENKVDTSISIVGFVGGSTFTGGLMVWGIGPDGKKMAVSLTDESDNKELLLDSGSWDFFATGWLGTTPLYGATMCGSTSLELAGEDAVINLSLNASNCIDDVFAPATYLDGNQFSPIKLIMCDNISSVTQGLDCDAAKGPGRSYRLVFNNVGDSEVTPGLTSACIDEAGASSTTTTTYKLPVGLLGSSPMNLTIETFSGLTCTGELKAFNFSDGLINTPDDVVIFNAGSQSEVFLSSPVPPPLLSGYTVSAALYTQNITIVSNNVTNIGGDIISYTIAPSLPSGLSINATTGDITGTPIGMTTVTTYTVTAMGPTGATATTTLDITVNDVVPDIISYTNQSGSLS